MLNAAAQSTIVNYIFYILHQSKRNEILYLSN